MFSCPKTLALCLAALAVWGRAAVGQPVGQPRRVSRTEPAAAVIPLAAGGYCVVTLRDRGEWRAGNPQAAATFDGRRYQFAGERELAIFAAAPTRYAPVLGGDCPVAWVEEQRRTPGRVESGAVHGGRVYFFADERARARFIAEPQRYADADLAGGGLCPVTRAERGRGVAGLPETAVLDGGMRWLFAGDFERRMFLENPEPYAGGASPAVGVAVAARAPTLQSGWRVAEDEVRAAEAGASGGGKKKARGAPATTGGDEILPGSQPAMGGYCPVTIRRKGAWVRGRYDDRVELGALVFFTAGSDERDAMAADPAQFVPALGGECPVSLADLGEHVRGSIFHTVEYQNRLYLFADAQRKATFKEDPSRYAALDLAANGSCAVTLVDEGRTLPGFVEYAAWYEGLLYRFASAEKKSKFLASPDKYAARVRRGGPTPNLQTPEAANVQAQPSPAPEDSPPQPAGQPEVAQ